MADDKKPPEDGDDKPIKFELKLISLKGQLRAGQVTSGTQQSDPDVKHKRHSQEKVRKVADQYTEEALLKYVHLMRTSPDERIQMSAADRILNRAIGMAKPLSEEEKKGADAGSILDVLAAMSAQQSALERQDPEAPALEHNAEDESFERLMSDINADGAIDDDAEDGELIDG